MAEASTYATFLLFGVPIAGAIVVQALTEFWRDNFCWKPTARSHVPDHEGPCKATWLNHSQIDNRLDGGITGFFRLVRKIGPLWVAYGPEFHGIAPWGTNGTQVFTTEQPDPWGEPV